MRSRMKSSRGLFLAGITAVLTCVGLLPWGDYAAAASRVNVMPNRQVRPGVALPVWGNAGNGGAVGDGSANAEAFSWTFAANANVLVAPASSAGAVANDRYIASTFTFTLQNGSTRELITATLTVGGTSKSVAIDIVDPTDPISNTDVKKLTIDVNIAIEGGLRAMYLAQQSNGSWLHGFITQEATCATTGFTVWAFSNSGHQPTNNINADIYAEWVQKGVNFIVDGAAPAAGPFPLLPDGVTSPDADANNRIINLCPGTEGLEGYATPIAATGIIAAYSGNPLTVVPVAHQFAGQTYKQVLQDVIDWIAFGQADCCLGPVGAGGAEGGWRYVANGGADTSADSWNFGAMEGFEVAFGGTVLEEVKREAERRLDASQCQVAPIGRLGYTGCSPLGFDGNATTAGGVSGLVLISRGGRTAYHLDPGGGAHDLTTATFPDVITRKSAALSHIGLQWDAAGGTWAGNMPNFYAMWTTARALRLNGSSSLTNPNGTFDWQTGEQPPGSGTVNPNGGPNEGYFHFLVRTQAADGSWAPTVNTFDWTLNLNTAWGILILQPTVFGPPTVEQAIPTLTEWAQIVMMSLLLLGGLWALRRRRGPIGSA